MILKSYWVQYWIVWMKSSRHKFLTGTDGILTFWTMPRMEPEEKSQRKVCPTAGVQIEPLIHRIILPL